ncbi:MAG: DUF1501 domain-containing protein [Deltaproteobacteria bacterium]|nr:DUF1501 domain-containing protein [Deltaproteobacteria bacterium]
MSMISRRELLVGGTAALGAATVRGRSARAEVSSVARNLILVVANGGWDPVYALDPKDPGLETIDSPEGVVQQFAGLDILTDPSRPAVASFFEAHASQIALVNGVQVQSIVHSDCFKRIMTGTSSDTSPDFGAITAFEHGSDLPAPYLVLGQTNYTGPFASLAAKTGSTNQLGLLVDPLNGLPVGDPYDPEVPLVLDATERDLIRDFVLGSAEQRMAARGALGSNRSRLQDFIDSFGRGEALRELGSFGELDYVRELPSQVDLALLGLERQLCFVAHLEAGDFDTHQDNAAQTDEHQAFYAGLQYLMDELTARPGAATGSRMIDETVVVVLSEMGRTPRLNGSGGKDHWPVTSTMVMGAGVAGGRVLGGTDDRLGAQLVNLDDGSLDPEGVQLQYANLVAGILALVGVDPADYLNAAPLGALMA